MRKTISIFVVSGILGFVLTACATRNQLSETQEIQAVGDALARFIQAFENGDLALMQNSFAEDATTFPRAIMSTDTTVPINNNDYKRTPGIDPQMQQLIERLASSGAEPPYLTLNPVDLDIQIFGEAALATFHLFDGDALSRRSFLLTKRDGEWKIVHLHASNVVSSD